MCIRNAVGAPQSQVVQYQDLQKHRLFSPIAGGAGKPL